MPWRRRRSEDFAREIDAHLAHEIDHLVRDGMDPHEARLVARRRFGSISRTTDRFRESGRLAWLDHLGHDVRASLRSLGRHPIACAVAVLSLAGGIGNTTATLTVMNALFFNAPPLYRQPDQLSHVTVSTPEERRGPVPGALYATWLADAALRSAVAAASDARPADIRTADLAPTPVRVRQITPDLFGLLGVQAAVGRTLSSSDHLTGALRPVVLSHAVWHNVFGGSSDVIGTNAWIDHEPHEIVGVMPERFWFSSMDAEVWIPLPEAALHATALEVVVRRPTELSADALVQRLQRDADAYAARLPQDQRRIRVLASNVRGTPMGRQFALIIPPLVAMAVLLTLLIACANVAILMFARWTMRERDIAIRTSLGASRGRVIRLLLTETIIIAVTGGVLGVWATFAMRRWIFNRMPGAELFDMTIDGAILLEAAAITMFTGILSGLGPALIETRRLSTNPVRLIASSDRVRQRWRHALVISEISVTVALLVVAGSQIDASYRMIRDDMGYSPAPLLAARVQHSTAVNVTEALNLMRGIPGVAGVAAATDMPMRVQTDRQRVAATADGTAAVGALRSAITPEFFSILGVPLRVGRAFEAGDLSSSSMVVIVNEALAHRLWSEASPIGAHLWIEGVPHAVVGVIANYKRFPLSPPYFGFFVPMGDNVGRAGLSVLVRAAADPTPLVDGIRRETDRFGGGYTASAGAFTDMIEVGSREIMALGFALTPLLGMGLFLTGSGIFGVLAFAVARRSRELALRVAIGAGRRDVVQLVTAHSLTLTLVGAAIGVGITFMLTRLVGAFGGAGSAFDTPSWPAFVVPVAIVVGVVALATWIPTRRALRINPALLLRTE